MQKNPNAYNEYDWSENNEQLTRPDAPRQLDRSQKIAVAILAFFAIAVFVVWVIQFKQGLGGPSKPKSAVNESGNAINETDLRQKDTDKDGLNDYEELNVYGTSPYLEDSDSDGYGDQDEIKNNNDPNCPVGQICSGSGLTEVDSDTGKEENINELNDKLQTVPSNSASSLPGQTGAPVDTSAVTEKDATAQMENAQAILEGQGDAASLRQILLSSGMDPTVLSQISDEELMTTYNDILSKQ